MKNNLNSKYLQIANIVEQHLNAATKNTTNKNLTKLQYLIKNTDPKNINYDNYVLEYAQLYWMRNYWKSVYFFDYEYSLKASLKNFLVLKNDTLKIVSLGSGPAADVIAYLAWLSINCKFSVNKIELFLVDKRKNQLDFAKKIINQVVPYFFELEIKVNYIQADVTNWCCEKNSKHIVLMGHFLTANSKTLQKIIEKSIDITVSDGDILIMERHRDPIWKKAANTYAHLGLFTYSTQINYKKFSQMLSDLPDNTIDKKITPHYLKVRLPMHKNRHQTISKYFRSWRFQTPDLLEDIFLENIVFSEKPGIDPPLNGLKEIYNYWESNPMLQQNINIWLRDVAHDNYNTLCAFEGEFDTPTKHISIKGAMSFHFDTYYQKVSRFNAYFGTTKTDLTF